MRPGTSRRSPCKRRCACEGASSQHARHRHAAHGAFHLRGRMVRRDRVHPGRHLGLGRVQPPAGPQLVGSRRHHRPRRRGAGHHRRRGKSRVPGEHRRKAGALPDRGRHGGHVRRGRGDLLLRNAAGSLHQPHRPAERAVQRRAARGRKRADHRGRAITGRHRQRLPQRLQGRGMRDQLQDRRDSGHGFPAQLRSLRRLQRQRGGRGRHGLPEPLFAGSLHPRLGIQDRDPCKRTGLRSRRAQPDLHLLGHLGVRGRQHRLHERPHRPRQRDAGAGFHQELQCDLRQAGLPAGRGSPARHRRGLRLQRELQVRRLRGVQLLLPG